MKHKIPFLLLAMFCIIASACSSDETQVRKAAQKYLNATANYRIDEAMPYASQVTRETTLPFVRDVVIPLTDSNYIKANQPATILIDSIQVLCADTAKVNYTKTTPIRVLSADIMMVKEGGKWLAHMPIDPPQPQTEEPEEDNNSDDAQ